MRGTRREKEKRKSQPKTTDTRRGWPGGSVKNFNSGVTDTPQRRKVKRDKEGRGEAKVLNKTKNHRHKERVA